MNSPSMDVVSKNINNIEAPTGVNLNDSKERHKKNNGKKIAWLIIGGMIILSIVTSSFQEKKKAFDFMNRPVRYSEKFIEGSGNDVVAVIKVQGMIIDSGTNGTTDLLGGEMADAQTIIDQLDQAQNDEAVKAVILSINSPGGTVPATQMITEKIKSFKKSGKKIVALMREQAASGGYYLSAFTDKIVANPSTLTGSIGVVMELQNWEGLYKKIGIKPVVIKAGKFKDIGSNSRAATPEEMKMLQDLVDEDYQMFVEDVSTGRGMTVDEVKKLAEGKIYSGRDAKKLNLVDELGNMPEAINQAKSLANTGEARVVEYVPNWAENIFGSLSGTGISGMLSKLNLTKKVNYSGTMYLWVP